MKISSTGIALIKRWEGLRDTPYKDIAGHLTIGYGHLIKDGERFTQITQEEAEHILKLDLVMAEDYVTDMTEIAPNQSQFDALVSFTFNLGPNALKRSDLLTYHNEGETVRAARAFTNWMSAAGKPSKGLLIRRMDEARLYLSTT